MLNLMEYQSYNIGNRAKYIDIQYLVNKLEQLVLFTNNTGDVDRVTKYTVA